jgi:hypothetical protein
MNTETLRERIFTAGNTTGFNELALEIFRFQYENCEVYREFADALSRIPGNVKKIEDIPFIPVEFYKSREVICSGMKPVREFRSSGTSGSIPGRHLLADQLLYNSSLLKGFEYAYGDPAGYTFLSLTPLPDENPHSSLIYMIGKLMQQNPGLPHGFFLKDARGLMQHLRGSDFSPGKTILIGLTWALLDFGEKYPGDYPGLVVIETGGMKGRRKEITRAELHQRLKETFNCAAIHSEYGMTELLSQAWSVQEGIFRTPPWMKVMVREVNDPFCWCSPGRTGGISIIDLANLYSCSFIASQDLGRMNEDLSFEVLGRFDSSDLRGCSLMIQE